MLARAARRSLRARSVIRSPLGRDRSDCGPSETGDLLDEFSTPALSAVLHPRTFEMENSEEKRARVIFSRVYS